MMRMMMTPMHRVTVLQAPSLPPPADCALVAILLHLLCATSPLTSLPVTLIQPISSACSPFVKLCSLYSIPMLRAVFIVRVCFIFMHYLGLASVCAAFLAQLHKLLLLLVRRRTAPRVRGWQSHAHSRAHLTTRFALLAMSFTQLLANSLLSAFSLASGVYLPK